MRENGIAEEKKSVERKKKRNRRRWRTGGWFDGEANKYTMSAKETECGK